MRVVAGPLADALTMAFFGSAVTLYAVGYMRGDDHRFLAFFPAGTPVVRGDPAPRRFRAKAPAVLAATAPATPRSAHSRLDAFAGVGPLPR